MKRTVVIARARVACVIETESGLEVDQDILEVITDSTKGFFKSVPAGVKVVGPVTFSKAVTEIDDADWLSNAIILSENPITEDELESERKARKRS